MRPLRAWGDMAGDGGRCGDWGARSRGGPDSMLAWREQLVGHVRRAHTCADGAAAVGLRGGSDGGGSDDGSGRQWQAAWACPKAYLGCCIDVGTGWMFVVCRPQHGGGSATPTD